MATKTIYQLPTAVSIDLDDDFVPFWNVLTGETEKISPANLLGGAITGTGTNGRIPQWGASGAALVDSTLAKTGAGVLTLAAASTYTLTAAKTGTVPIGTGTAGRVAEWVTDANTIQASTLAKTGAGVLTLAAAAAYTLTVPATGTAALLGTAQTFSALQTFSNGIVLGGTTLSNYDENTWTPVITGSGSNPTVAYTSQTGYYTRIGNIVMYQIGIEINTISGGSGNARFSLPFTVNTNRRSPSGGVVLNNVGWGSGATAVVFYPSGGVAYGELRGLTNNSALTTVGVSDLSAGDILVISGYMVV